MNSTCLGYSTSFLNQFLNLFFIFYRSRARRTITDFVKSYFPYHGLKIDDFFEYWDVLVFVEGTIYQMDEINESFGTKDGPLSTADVDYLHNTMAILKKCLSHRGLLTDAIEKELDSGLKFWESERSFCSFMKAHPHVPLTGYLASNQPPPEIFSPTDVHAASLKKSFDYRVLNLLLYKLRGLEPDPQLLEFLLVDEQLIDRGDDLADYEDDIINNSFNFYRLYIHLFGQEAPLRLIEHISALESKHAELLSRLPLEMQQLYEKRKIEAVEGETNICSSSGPASLLTWTIVNPILNELSYRTEFN